MLLNQVLRIAIRLLQIVMGMISQLHMHIQIIIDYSRQSLKISRFHHAKAVHYIKAVRLYRVNLIDQLHKFHIRVI